MKRRPNPARNRALSPSQPLSQAIGLLRQERVAEAEPVLERILQRWPDQPDALHFLGVLRHRQGRVDEAEALIRRALAQLPRHAAAWNNLGNVLLLAGRAEQAAQAYASAVAFAGDSPETRQALNNLGVLHRRLNQLDQSEQVLRDALARSPDDADAWYNLSITLIKAGRVHEGLMAHSKAVTLRPAQQQSRQQVISALMMLGERDSAASLLREWLAAEPGQPVAEHLLAACVAGAQHPAAERASDRYVQQVFDSFAASFDARLEALQYRAPQLVTDALRVAAGTPAARLDIVDAGCGTGLCGAGLRPFARRLAGCDLSAGMLGHARARQLYDQLDQAELTQYLQSQPQGFDAVVSADTLIYFGALDAVFAAAHGALRPEGVLVFTLEALPEGSGVDHRLQLSGRYAHAADYLRRALAAAGLELRELRAEDLRKEAGEPVRGWLVTALRRDPGAPDRPA